MLFRLPNTAASMRAQPRCRFGAAPQRRGALRVRAAWGDPVAFAPAKVLSKSRAADSLYSVVVDVGADAAAAYTRPGQYVQLKPAGCAKPGFFAIASPPDANNAGALEFLIKAAGEAAEALVGLKPGAELEASPVQGKGFPLERLEGASSVLIFATGSGISPIRAVIESGALGGAGGRAQLFYGTRSPAATAFADRIPEWRAAGVDVVQVFSDGEGGRYVQDAYAAAGAKPADPARTKVLLCGQKGMAEAVKELLGAQGVPADAFLSNF